MFQFTAAVAVLAGVATAHFSGPFDCAPNIEFPPPIMPIAPPAPECVAVWHPEHGSYGIPMDNCDDHGATGWHWVQPLTTPVPEYPPHTWATSTVTTVDTQTIYACAPTVDNCPASEMTHPIVTTTVVVTPTICPKPVITTSAVVVPPPSPPQATQPPVESTPATAPAPTQPPVQTPPPAVVTSSAVQSSSPASSSAPQLISSYAETQGSLQPSVSPSSSVSAPAPTGASVTVSSSPLPTASVSASAGPSAVIPPYGTNVTITETTRTSICPLSSGATLPAETTLEAQTLPASTLTTLYGASPVDTTTTSAGNYYNTAAASAYAVPTAGAALNARHAGAGLLVAAVVAVAVF